MTTLIYGLNSPKQAACAMPGGVVGHLQIPDSTAVAVMESLRGAHLFGPVPVHLVGPIHYDAARNVFVCAAIVTPAIGP